ncbi:MAG: hypothetical protein ACK4FA_02350 [Candidatus Paceibacteria bacterium]
MKKNIIALLGVIVLLALVAIYFVYLYPKDQKITEESNTIDMCFSYSKKTARGFEDRAWLIMKIEGEKVTGEYRNLPAEKDSKVGKFAGTVGAFDPYISGRRADVMWDSLAEGMKVTEELMIEFGEGSAVALFGEMVDRGDGVYVYKDKTKVTPGFLMGQVDCESMQERQAVETYLRAHISDLAEPAVLGGTWYVLDTSINTTDDVGDVTYEDGHIQKTNHFSYTFDKVSGKVEILNFNFGK